MEYEGFFLQSGISFADELIRLFTRCSCPNSISDHSEAFSFGFVFVRIEVSIGGLASVCPNEAVTALLAAVCLHEANPEIVIRLTIQMKCIRVN